MSTAATSTRRALYDEIAACYADPVRFVRLAYPWGKVGTSLSGAGGPYPWQIDVLNRVGGEVARRKFRGRDPVAPIREAISSGHGIGKSALSAWLTNWLMSTRPHSQGTVTANTRTQLTTKTWAAIQRWTRLCLTASWWDVGSDRIRHKDAPESWFASAQTCREENAEAFAGQHAADSTSWYLFDEASAIPDVVWEVAEGGTTDGEPMHFAFGNPTRSTGRFHRAAFGADRGRWHTTVIDSRTVPGVNQDLIREWLETYGEDSDFVRVRVRGLPPRASDANFIGQDLVFAAQSAVGLAVLSDEPLVCGLDVARGGGDTCVFRFRRGADARSIPPIVIPGEQVRDNMRLVTVAADILGRDFNGQKIAALFVDGTGVGGPTCDRLRQMGHANVIEIQFGAASPDRHDANMRAYIWRRMREWLGRGMVDADAQLEADLTGPGYGHDKHDRLVLESKESMKRRGLSSPDHGDALALTFASVVVARESVVIPATVAPIVPSVTALGWMG